MSPVAAVTVERFQADLNDSDVATRQTVERMAQHVRTDSADPLVEWCAQDARRRFAGSVPSRRSDAWAAWWFVKHCVKFEQDDSLLSRLLNDHDQQMELLISPAVMLRMQSRRGDCDDFTMLVCALLACLGCPWQIVTVAADPQEPWRWSHVYAAAVMEDGTRIPLDASHGKFPGWEVPSGHILRYQAWDENGQPVEGKPSASYMMHGYARRRGVGSFCDSETGTDYDTGGPCISDAGGGGGSAGVGFNWGGFFSGLTSQGLNLVGRIVAPTTTFSSRSGTLVTPGSLPPGTQLPGLFQGGSQVGASFSGIMPWLLIGAGVFVVSKLAKK